MKQKEQKLRDLKLEVLFLEGVLKRLPEHTPTMKALADSYTTLGGDSLASGLALDIKLSEKCPDDDLVWFNLACSWALMKNTDRAMEALQVAVDQGYRNLDWLLQDHDLDHIRGDARYQELVNHLEQLLNENPETEDA